MSNAVRQPRLAVVEQVAEALVGLLRRPEPRELAHRPQPAAVHARVHAARERNSPGQPDAAPIGRQVGLRVQRPDRLPRERGERDVALGVLPLLSGHGPSLGSACGQQPAEAVDHGSGGARAHPQRARGARPPASAARRARASRGRGRRATRLRSAARSLRAVRRRPPRDTRPMTVSRRAPRPGARAARAAGRGARPAPASGCATSCARRPPTAARRAVPAHAHRDVAGGQRRAVAHPQPVAHAAAGAHAGAAVADREREVERAWRRRRPGPAAAGAAAPGHPAGARRARAAARPRPGDAEHVDAARVVERVHDLAVGSLGANSAPQVTFRPGCSSRSARSRAGSATSSKRVPCSYQPWPRSRRARRSSAPSTATGRAASSSTSKRPSVCAARPVRVAGSATSRTTRRPRSSGRL